MLVHRMVKKVKDSKVLAKIGMKDATNYNGERSFQTFEAWKRACKQINPSVVFEGDKDICQAKPGIGEWDGNEGIIYTKDSKTKDKIFYPEAIIKVRGQKKKVSKPVVAESQEEAKEKLKAFIVQEDSTAEILEMTCDSKIKVKDSIKSRFNFKKTKNKDAYLEIKEDGWYVFGYNQNIEGPFTEREATEYVKAGKGKKAKYFSKGSTATDSKSKDSVSFIENYKGIKLYKDENHLLGKFYWLHPQTNQKIYWPTLMEVKNDIDNHKKRGYLDSNSKITDAIELKKSDAPDDQFDAEQLAMGIKVEQEHTDDLEIAKAIAKAHLSEKNSSKYYSYLVLLEDLMKNNVSLESIQGLLK